MNFFELEPILQIILAFILLAVVVTLIRFLVRLARRALTCGCVVLLVGGGILVLINAAGWIIR